ncbi:transposase [Ruminococcus flavefaciens]|uniref:transposase n=1 Tax=Ruminococcus flavefaciens TaxID=1265 RepID=UPI00048ECB11|nr:transposase [Ruminococcus flavefaciens]
MEKVTRKYIRLANYDYSSNGLYFITICAKNRIHYFSEITEVGEAALGLPNIRLTDIGKIVNNNILKINEIYKYVSVEKYVIMPDHIHMILFVSDYDVENGGRPRAASPTKSVNLIINGLKTILTKQIGFSVWQRSFHDHIIRNEKEFLEICDYIDNNPINWVNDIYNQNYWR